MTARTLNLDDSLYHYLLDVSLRETPLLKRLRDETQALPMARWQVAPEQGQFLALLVKLTGAGVCWKSEPSPVTARCAWRRHCPMTAR